MRTTNKEVVKKIQEHILEYSTLQELRDNLEAVKYGDMTDYRGAVALVEGGCFLCYDNQVDDFLINLDINELNKKYDNVKSWNLYCHLLAREILKLINK
jgi:hypothetical protein